MHNRDLGTIRSILLANSSMALLALYLALALAGVALALWRPPRMPCYSLLLAIAALPQLGQMLGIRIPAMFLVSVAVIAIWCLCNRAVSGVPIVSVGVALNLLVMGLHGGAMPISADTLARIGHLAQPGTLLAGSKDIVVQSAHLAFLSDWVVLPSGVMTVVASPGDLLVLIGIVWWLLFSHKQERDQTHDDAWRRSHGDRSSCAAPLGPKRAAGAHAPGAAGGRQPDRRRATAARPDQCSYLAPALHGDTRRA
jgi:hypothetical protein